ncbi:hypothetical protein JCM19235_1931 [Vibrio maritimus]|uniref:Uncharacterized protein n=1 Tax=Vibrio maritimus TaxID=990268 RepID=A0A090RVF3_9VIBR|nr:hypothetical protein JCM19235_1931 [Vibrio maritimus]
MDKAISEMEKGRLTVMLIPGDTAAHWYHKALAHCTEFHIIRGRISFVNALTQKAVHGNNKGSTVFVFNPKSFTKRLPVLVDKTEMQKLGAA